MNLIDKRLNEFRPRTVAPSPVKIRHVFIAVFFTGLFCGLMIADPLTRMFEVVK